MAKLTPEYLVIARAGVLTVLDQAFRSFDSMASWNLVATEIPTTLATQDHAFLGASPIMEEVTDEPREQPLREGSYTLTDKLYKARLPIPRKWLEDDQTGLIRTRAAELGEAAMRHDNKLVYQLLTSGFAALCHDGQYFFDSDHSEGDSGTQSNTTSSSLSDSSLETAVTAMMGFLDDRGEPRGVVPDTLVVGPKLARKATDLAGSDVVVIRVGDGTAGTGATAATPFSNYHKGIIKQVIVSEYITNFNWFVLQAQTALKPLILQKRSDIGQTVEDDFLDPKALQREKFIVDVRERKVSGYGPWFKAYGSSASS